MTPTDFRNHTWDSIQRDLNASRQRVLAAWRTHGPGTTREIAARSGIDLLTFRPRTTDLYDLGLVVLAELQPVKGEGVYQAASRECWEANHAPEEQGQLALL